MSLKVEIKRVDAQPTAVVKRLVAQSDLPVAIPQASGVVWEFVKERGIPAGRHIALYHDMEMNVEIGVEVEGAFVSDGNVVASELPAGRVAVTRVIGDYSGIPAGHMALHAWFEANGVHPTGLSWELYGHWSDNPAEVYTDIYYIIGD